MQRFTQFQKEKPLSLVGSAESEQRSIQRSFLDSWLSSDGLSLLSYQSQNSLAAHQPTPKPITPPTTAPGGPPIAPPMAAPPAAVAGVSPYT